MSSSYDLLIKGGLVVTSTQQSYCDLAIKDGRITEISEDIRGQACQIIEAGGLFILPGYIDAHVHLNEPGREHWEGFCTGSTALAAGGCTTFLDMPLNSTPVLDAASFHAKAAALKKHSLIDGALWGGLVPSSLNQMEEMAQCGVIGFKAFMSNSGMDDFPRADLFTLKEGMKRAVELGRLVAVHAEKEELVASLSEKAQSEGRRLTQDYLDSRPIEAELIAIGEALDLAETTGCSLHIVHVSSAAGLKLIYEAKRKGVDVSAETCPHYLLLTDQDVIQSGALAKCAPPLRSALEQEKIWKALTGGWVDTIGSDHSPSPPELKVHDDFFKVWGGIAGAQHNYPLLFAEAVINRGLPPNLIARLTSTQVAQRFGLTSKGDIKLGGDADLVLLRKCEPRKIRSEELKTRHPISAYTGKDLTIEVVHTLCRGHFVHGPHACFQPGSARILHAN